MTNDQDVHFATRVEQLDGKAVVMVRGEVDMATSEEFRRALDAAVQQHGRVMIDLGETTFMDSTGLAVLVDAHLRLGEAREAIVVRNAPARIRRLFDITGVASLMDVRLDDPTAASPAQGAEHV